MENVGNILGYGIPSNIFDDQFNSITNDKREILERIARRFQTIIKLNHESLFISNPDVRNGSNLAFYRWELSSIQIYLYCTCVDTLAGKPKYVEFHDWLKNEDLVKLDSKKIDEYHDKYLFEYGNKRSFDKFFNELSPTVKSWLNQNVSIQKSQLVEVPDDRDEEKLIEHLIDYFYRYWRNPFTHQSITRPVDFFPDIFSLNEYYSQIDDTFHLATREWVRQPTAFELSKEKGEWNFWHKKEIDLAVILRIVIQAVVFKWLKLDLTDDIINRIVYRIQRLHWLYSYIHEIRINADDLGSWKEIRENYSSDHISSLRNSGVLHLSLVASNKLIEFLHGQNPFEEQQREYLREYIECVTKINTQIEFFNKEHPRLEKYNAEIEHKTREEIKDFLTGLTTQKEYMEIIKNSRTPWRFWELININSEYESKDTDY